jgi:hypothetical protein
MKPTGHVLWTGPSMLDGAPIAAIAITESTNRKTGNMVQTYILRTDVHPLEALKSGADASICGDCKHRPALGGACYVRVSHGPTSVYRAFTRGRYPVAPDIAALGADRAVRLGTYGDPAVVPAHVWESLISRSTSHTGYTHQWANRKLPPDHVRRITALCMASVDSIPEAIGARLAGLRYFRVHTGGTPAQGEFTCPASAEAGKRKTCATCGACDGTEREGKASPIIVVHGARASRFAARA